jgi:hypothetical protein
MPAFALLVGRGWDELNHISWLDKMLLALVGVGVGVLLLALPSLQHQYHLAIWLADIPVWTGAMVVLGSVLLMLSAGASKIRYFQHVALMALLLISMLWLGVIRTAGEAYDVRPISYHLKRLQDRNIPLAHIGTYYGQFNFLGRLLKSPEVLSESQLNNWFKKNPQGQVIIYIDNPTKLKAVKPEYKQLYRGSKLLCILTQAQWQLLSEQSNLSLSNETSRSE